MEHIFDTPLATLERIGPFLIEVRFKSHALIHPDGMKELHEARWRIFKGAPHVVLSLIPADLEVDLDLVSIDTHSHRRVNDGLRAAALVATGAIAEMVAKLYYAYYPPHFNLLVSPNEQAARDWVAAQLAAIESEGSRSVG